VKNARPQSGRADARADDDFLLRASHPQVAISLVDAPLARAWRKRRAAPPGFNPSRASGSNGELQKAFDDYLASFNANCKRRNIADVSAVRRACWS